MPASSEKPKHSLAPFLDYREDFFVIWRKPQILPPQTKITRRALTSRKWPLRSNQWETLLHTSRSLIYLNGVTAVVTHTLAYNSGDHTLTSNCRTPGSFQRKLTREVVLVFLTFFWLHLLISIQPLVLAHLPPCDSPDQAAHYHIFGILSDRLQFQSVLVWSQIDRFLS